MIDNFISVAQLNTTFVHLHTCVSFRSKAYFRIAKWIDPEIYRWFTCVHYVETNIVSEVFCMVFFLDRWTWYRVIILLVELTSDIIEQRQEFVEMTLLYTGRGLDSNY